VGTNKEKDSLVTVAIETKQKLKMLAKKDGRTMKGFLAYLLSKYEKGEL